MRVVVESQRLLLEVGRPRGSPGYVHGEAGVVNLAERVKLAEPIETVRCLLTESDAM